MWQSTTWVSNPVTKLICLHLVHITVSEHHYCNCDVLKIHRHRLGQIVASLWSFKKHALRMMTIEQKYQRIINTHENSPQPRATAAAGPALEAAACALERDLAPERLSSAASCCSRRAWRCWCAREAALRGHGCGPGTAFCQMSVDST